MTPKQIIQEINHLDYAGRLAVLKGAVDSIAPRELSTDELVELAKRMAGAPTQQEGDELERQLMEGYYGRPFNA